MTHYRMLDRAPSVVITSNRNELKVYQDNVVYLNDGDNFELRFFNPLQEKIGVEIMFNGLKKGDGFLVVNPGQDLILDRFLDEQRKMLFETYVIDGNNEAAVEAIQQNGIITFNFYKEHVSYYRSSDEKVNINYNFPPKPHKWNTTATSGNIYNTTNNYYTGNTGNFGLTGHSGISGTSGSGGISGVRGCSGPQGAAGTKGFTCISSTNSNSRMYNTTLGASTTLTSSTFVAPGIFTSELDSSFVTSDSFEALNDELETGRIEKGDISSQTLKSVNLQFISTPFHTVTYKFLPYSAMNRTIGEVRQYCGFCSYRLRKNTWKYCPKCGNKLD